MKEIIFPYADEMSDDAKFKLTALLNRPELKALRRPTWVPVTEDDQTPFKQATSSRYGGLPWSNGTGEWPLCGVCHRPLQFFFQVNLQELPDAAQAQFGTGLLQFFYCTRKECAEKDKLPPTRVYAAKIVDPCLPGKLAEISEGQNVPFAVTNIENWEEQIDYYPSELERFGVEVSDEEDELLAGWGPLRTDDKLGGWPAWLQQPELFSCSVCGREMHLLFQFEPEVHLKYTFGQEYYDHSVESGYAWLSQCPEHKSEFAFAWHCH